MILGVPLSWLLAAVLAVGAYLVLVADIDPPDAVVRYGALLFGGFLGGRYYGPEIVAALPEVPL